MNIVVTDGYTLNSGDLNWDLISSLGPLTVHERTPAHLIADRCRDANIVLTNKVPIDQNIIAQLPSLKYISVLATGYNLIDTNAARGRNIAVSNVPGYGTPSVAQHVFALLLELTNAVGVHSQSTKKGEWQISADWAYTKQPMIELSGKTMGIIGFGNIGQNVAAIAAAFGMQVIYYNPRVKNSPIASQRSIESVFRESDVVTLHCPLKPENQQFVNEALLASMKPSAFLINTARGGLIDEKALSGALNNRVIAGAALDVLSTEPPAETNPLLSAPNCIITPHNAWMSREARQRILTVTAGNIRSFLDGKPVNVVN